MIRKFPFSTKNLTSFRSRINRVFECSEFSQFQTKNTLKISTTYNKSVFHNFSTQKIVVNSQISSINALQSMQQIQKFVSSDAFKKHFNSYYYLQKYSWMCIHTWMLLYRIRKCQNFSEIVNGYLLKKKILKLLQEYTREQVYEYDDIFDRQVYEELKRVQQVIFWSLDQYFVFNLKEKGLAQIIDEDFSLFWEVQEPQNISDQTKQHKQKALFEGLENNQTQSKYSWQKQDEIKKVAEYFLTKLQEIQKMEFEKIKKGELSQWLKI